jgi:lysophospholipase L1-like esterase
VKIANRGISGDTTRGVLIRLQEDVLVLNPVAIVLLIGTNDLDEAATPEMIASNVKLILAAIKAHDPKTPVVLCQVMPSSPSKNRPAEKIKKVNELYLAAVKNDPQIIPSTPGACSPTPMATRRSASSRTCSIRTTWVTGNGRPR